MATIMVTMYKDGERPRRVAQAHASAYRRAGWKEAPEGSIAARAANPGIIMAPGVPGAKHDAGGVADGATTPAGDNAAPAPGAEPGTAGGKGKTAKERQAEATPGAEPGKADPGKE